MARGWYNGGQHGDWKQLPIPDVPPEKQTPVVKLVDRILEAKRRDAGADVTDWEREIDRLVHDLYGLTKEQTVVGRRTARKGGDFSWRHDP